MTNSPHSPQSQLTLTLPRATRAQWHSLALGLGLRPAGLAVAMLHAVDTNDAVARALAQAAGEVQRRDR